MITYLLYYLLIANAVGFLVMGIDKLASKRRGARRISENNLIFLAIIGASIGTILGMVFFRHKTRKTLFTLGLPLILILQIGLVYLIMEYV